MKYLVIELQTATDGTVSNLVYQFDTQNEAESKFHYILSYAAVSTLPTYSAFIITNEGRVVASSCYTHTTE